MPGLFLLASHKFIVEVESTVGHETRCNRYGVEGLPEENTTTKPHDNKGDYRKLEGLVHTIYNRAYGSYKHTLQVAAETKGTAYQDTKKIK